MKREGDERTPKGKFKFILLLYRKDRINYFHSKIKKKIIKKNMGWCDDVNSKFYNKEIKTNKKVKHEKLFRKDNSYDCLVVINFNTKNIERGKGSAIFLHLTKNYKKTNGCIAVKKNDLFVILNLINKKTKIKI